MTPEGVRIMVVDTILVLTGIAIGWYLRGKWEAWKRVKPLVL